MGFGNDTGDSEKKERLEELESPAETPELPTPPSDDDGEVYLPTPPDGGWGWMVVFGSFIIHIIADGVAYSFGILTIEFIRHFEAGRGEVGWIGSLMIGITWGSGPIASALTNRYGCRNVTIIGAIMASIGFIISIWAPNIYYLYFSYGIVAGLGLGLIYLPAIVSVTYYFEKKRAFATGLAVCGSGLGTFIFAPASKVLVYEYAWTGASLIMGGLILNCIVCGALFRPLEIMNIHKPSKKDKGSKVSYKKNGTNGKANDIGFQDVYIDERRDSSPEPVVESPGRKPIFSKNSSRLEGRNHFRSLQTISQENSESLIKRHRSEDHIHKPQMQSPAKHDRPADHIGPIARKDVFYTSSLHNIPLYRSNHNMYTQSILSIPELSDSEDKTCCSCSPEMKDALKQMTNFGLLKDPLFLMFAISNFCTSVGFCVPYMYLPDRAIQLGMTEQQGAFLISVVGIANTVGRVVFGWLSDRPFVNRLMLYNTVLTLCGISTVLSSFCTTFPLLATYAACFGMFLGVYVSLTSVVLVDLLGLECLTNSFGLTLLFQGIGAIVGPPIAGGFYDLTDSYDPGFWITGVIIAISGLMLFFIPCVQRWQEKKRGVSQHDYDMGRHMNDNRQVTIAEDEPQSA